MGSSGFCSALFFFDANPRSAGLDLVLQPRRRSSTNDSYVIVTPSLHPGPKTKNGRNQTMKVLEFEVSVGDGVAVGGLQVFPLTSEKADGPPYLTGPEAYGAGLIEVSELDHLRYRFSRSPTWPTCPSSSSKGSCSSVGIRTAR